MDVKRFIHPEEIRKEGLLYRSWHLLLANRIWHAERVPEKSHICLWFWPALFAALVFRPVAYPVLLALYSAVKYALVRPAVFIGRPTCHLLWLVTGGVARRLGALLAVPVGNRMAVGTVFLMALAFALCVTPGVNRWFTGIMAVGVASYLAAEFFIRAVGALFRSFATVGRTLGGQWHAALVSGGGKVRLALAGWVVLALLALPFVWVTGVALRILLFTMLIVAGTAGLLLVIAGIVRASRAVVSLARRSERAVRVERPGPTSVRQAKRRSPVRIYLEALVRSACPEVRFV